MEAHMDPSNCIGLYHWARDLGATDLADCALRYICQHFTQVGHSEQNNLSIYSHQKCFLFHKHYEFIAFLLSVQLIKAF